MPIVNMKRIIVALIAGGCISTPVLAGQTALEAENKIQTRIDSIGVNILNDNKIDKRVVFAYDKNAKKKILSEYKTLAKRQVIVYADTYKYVQTDDELAALLAREISTAVKTFGGTWGGVIDSIEVAAAPKKAEIVADKRAVDYLVKSGYNPLAVIVYINKTSPQKRTDFIGRHNLTSKRLARLYEYITYKYPEYLENNEYINNKYYQNFLLSSVNNRKMLEEKIKSGSKEELKYE